MYINTKTLHYDKLMINKLLGRTHVPDRGTTLNEKFEVGEPFEPGDPKLNLVTLGALPSNFNGATSVDLSTLKHTQIDASVYDPVPFFMHKEGEDVVPDENLRLESKIIVNGERYIAYYGYVIYGYMTAPETYRIVRDVGESTYGVFDFDFGDTDVLNPTPGAEDNYIAFKPNDYITTLSDIKFTLTTEMLLNIKDAFDIVYPDRDKVISEFGLATSIDDGKEVHSAQVGFLVNPMVFIDDTLQSTGEYYCTFTVGGMGLNITRS